MFSVGIYIATFFYPAKQLNKHRGNKIMIKNILEIKEKIEETPEAIRT
jgi:hypothetical protein